MTGQETVSRAATVLDLLYGDDLLNQTLIGQNS